MTVLKELIWTEFLDRIDDIIVFHALTKEGICTIVSLRLDRVVRTAAAQDITLKPDETLADHLVDVGYKPEFGARELKHQVRQTGRLNLRERFSATN